MDWGSLAQWVSAIGSILAIASGFALNTVNQRRARRATEEARAIARSEKLMGARHVVSTILSRTEIFISLIEPKHPSDRPGWAGTLASARENYRAASQMLGSMDLHTIDLGLLVGALFNLRIDVSSAIGYIESQFEVYSRVENLQLDISEVADDHKMLIERSAKAIVSSAKRVIDIIDANSAFVYNRRRPPNRKEPSA